MVDKAGTILMGLMYWIYKILKVVLLLPLTFVLALTFGICMGLFVCGDMIQQEFKRD